MRLPIARTPATLAAHEGELVERDDAPMLWLGEMSVDLIADLMSSGSTGAVPMSTADTGAREMWIQRCWYDVEERKMAVELFERPAPS